jgi:DegV family protein with EDD domain
MNKVAIMTDTVSGIPPKVAKEFDIKVVSLHIVMDGVSYLETEVDKAQLYARLARKENLPTTSSPTAEQYIEAYRELSQKTEAILHICYTSWIGMGYKEAMHAKNIATVELPKTNIEVIDSLTAHGAQLLCVLEAARAAAKGKRFPEIVDMVNGLIPRLNLLYILDTVYYLGKGGRMGKATAWQDPTIATKSILELDASTKGVMTPLTRTRTQAKAVEKVVKLVKERNKGRKLHAVVSHDDVPEQAQRLKQLLLSQLPVSELHITGVSLVPIIYDGPGALRLGWFSEG